MIVVSMFTVTISYVQETIIESDKVAKHSTELTSDASDTLICDNLTTSELLEDSLKIISDESQHDMENITNEVYYEIYMITQHIIESLQKSLKID